MERENNTARDWDFQETQIYKALAYLLVSYQEDGSVVLVEEPRSGKFVQFGPGRTLEMDVPHVALTKEEADRAYEFFIKLGEQNLVEHDYLIEYDAPDLKAGIVRHGATFNHNFGKNAAAAAKAAVAFFREVHLFPPGVALKVRRLF